MQVPVCARSLGRVLGLTAVALLALASPAASQDPSSSAPGYDAGLFEIRVARLAAQTVIVQVDPSGRVLLPVDAVLALTGMPVDRQHGDSLLVVPLVTRTGRDAGTASLDLRSRTLQLRDSVLTLPAGTVAIVDGETYLEVDWMRRLLSADIDVDFSALTATLTRVPPFPIEQQAQAAQRRTTVGRGALSLERGIRDAPYRKHTGGAVLDWNVSTAPDQPVKNSSAQAMLGIAVLGGSLTAGGNWATAGGDADLLAGNLNYTYNQPRSRWMRQMQLGDLFGGGVQLRSVRGASITNARYIREGLFSEVPIEPDVPSGWSYEVYQDGQLLGFAESGASQGVFIPLRYGTTPVRVRMLGPAGEEILSDFRYQIPSTQLAPGNFEYTAGVGRCRDVSCGVTAFARADWGATSRLTVGASGEWSNDDTSGTSRGLRGGVRAMAIPAHDWYATVDIVPAGRSQLLVTHDNYDGMNSAVGFGRMEPGGSVVSSIVGPEPRWFGDLRHSRPISRDGGPIRSARFELHGEGFQGEGLDRLFGSVTLDARRGSYGLRYEQDPSLSGGLLQLSHFTVIRRDAKGRFSYLPLSGSVAFAQEGLERLEGIATVRAGGRGSVNLAARWSAGSGTMLSLTYDALLGRARVSARGMSTGDGRSTLLTSAGGAAAWSRDAGPIFVDQTGSNLAGLAGRVFYDEDGDGTFGPGDQPASGLGVMAGNQRVKTDAEGRYRAWRILPYEVTSVSVDTLRDIASSFVPLRPEVVLRAAPNMYNTADFPLVRTRELMGRLVPGPGVASVGGVTVELLNATTGDTVRAMTFADGEFYISRVRPGTWELRIAASSVAALRAIAPEPMRVIVPGTGADVLVEIPEVRIQRATPRADSLTETRSGAESLPGAPRPAAAPPR